MKALNSTARILIGLSYGIFGYAHFAYAGDDMGLVPNFVGAAMFWVYFIGTCWWATALSFITNIMTRLSGILASVLLVLILLLVQLKGFHAPGSLLSLSFTIALIGGSLMVSAYGTMDWPFPRKNK